MVVVLASSSTPADVPSNAGIEAAGGRRGFETAAGAVLHIEDNGSESGVSAPGISDRAATDLPGSLAFDTRQLDTLIRERALEVLHPEGGVLRIDLDRIIESNGARILLVTSAGLRGVITERADNCFATIATPGGVYVLERRNGITQITDQQQLDLRSNPRDRDFRHAPLV